MRPPLADYDPIAEYPLHRRLGIRPDTSGLVIAPPEDSANPLLPLPGGIDVYAGIDEVADDRAPVDYIHYFARSRTELGRVLPQLRDRLAPDGSLWISWIKQSSPRQKAGLPGDINENVVRRMALISGLVDVRVAALNQDWSGLRLVFRKH